MNEGNENRVVVAVPAHEPDPPKVVGRRRLMRWVGAMTVVVMVAFLLLNRQSYDSRTVPDFLVGAWVTDSSPDYSDRYIELTPTGITFGTGGTSFVKYQILGIVQEEIDGVDTIVLHFEDVAGTDYKRRVVVGQSGLTMHFASQPAITWQRFTQ
jgi:hypothetical protein